MYAYCVLPRSNSVIGVEASYKPFPSVIERNRHKLSSVKTVLDIGAGTGRFVRWFLTNTQVESYLAIEPSSRGINSLKKIKQRDSRLEIIQSCWEFVRDRLIHKKFDVILLWNVLMFVDLTNVHGDDFKSAILKETECFVNMAKKYILLSFYPVKYGLVRTAKEFREVLQEFLKHGCEIVDRRYLNYILKVC